MSNNKTARQLGIEAQLCVDLQEALRCAIERVGDYIGEGWAEKDYADDPEALENLREQLSRWKVIRDQLSKSHEEVVEVSVSITVETTTVSVDDRKGELK